MNSEYVSYVSYNSHGVDATEFYKDFGVSMRAVSMATGVSRNSVSRVSIGHADKQNTEKVIQYLEYVSVNNMNRAISKLEEAWNDYERRENILNAYCQQHGVPRKKVPIKKIERNVLECLKDP